MIEKPVDNKVKRMWRLVEKENLRIQEKIPTKINYEDEFKFQKFTPTGYLLMFFDDNTGLTWSTCVGKVNLKNAIKLIEKTDPDIVTMDNKKLTDLIEGIKSGKYRIK